ncbi:hypothetical protein Gorai_024534 [Gossypium raimondii]|uniref:Uncharacterized protein n=1 Tax=Gossypium raimondii TaxID=29730 RepID=A0A7J8NZU3_GOSRA|nr:hypothetical protein [Gossypium raimondii]
MCSVKPRVCCSQRVIVVSTSPWLFQI